MRRRLMLDNIWIATILSRMVSSSTTVPQYGMFEEECSYVDKGMARRKSDFCAANKLLLIAGTDEDCSKTEFISFLTKYFMIYY